MNGIFSRRDALKLALNISVATFAGGALVRARSVFAQQVTAVLGHFGSANPQTLGKANGAFAKTLGTNVRTEYVTVSGGPQVIAAIAGNSMDICNVGSSPMVVGFAQGIKMSMVYVEKYITDSECLAVRKDAGINTLKDLKGKKIGLPFNTSVHFAMLAGLKTVGLTASDVNLINIKADSILATWQRKDIDGAYIWYPILGDCLADNGKILLKTGDLAASGTLVFDGIVVRDEFKRQHPDLVLAYLKEYDRLATMYEKQPQEVVKVLSPYLAMTPEKTMDYINTFHPVPVKELSSDKWMGLPGARDTGVLRTLQAQAEFLKAADQLTTIPPSWTPFVDSTFLAKMV
ncbi:MAG TPA: ABC transporter substrate-binding protein [Casimicrobiaceae bacterium]|nr:ABC transporter substrate-binding protein [Casimicrobiaceae bacterium]